MAECSPADWLRLLLPIAAVAAYRSRCRQARPSPTIWLMPPSVAVAAWLRPLWPVRLLPTRLCCRRVMPPARSRFRQCGPFAAADPAFCRQDGPSAADVAACCCRCGLFPPPTRSVPPYVAKTAVAALLPLIVAHCRLRRGPLPLSSRPWPLPFAATAAAIAATAATAARRARRRWRGLFGTWRRCCCSFLPLGRLAARTALLRQMPVAVSTVCHPRGRCCRGL